MPDWGSFLEKFGETANRSLYQARDYNLQLAQFRNAAATRQAELDLQRRSADISEQQFNLQKREADLTNKIQNIDYQNAVTAQKTKYIAEKALDYYRMTKMQGKGGKPLAVTEQMRKPKPEEEYQAYIAAGREKEVPPALQEEVMGPLAKELTRANINKIKAEAQAKAAEIRMPGQQIQWVATEFERLASLPKRTSVQDKLMNFYDAILNQKGGGYRDINPALLITQAIKLTNDQLKDDWNADALQGEELQEYKDAMLQRNLQMLMIEGVGPDTSGIPGANVTIPDLGANRYWK